jgi:hypothetical protein
MRTRKRKGFKLVLTGELRLRAHAYDAWQLPGCVVEIRTSLRKTLRDEETFRTAALAIGTAILERGVTYAEKGVQAWKRESKRRTTRSS